MAEGYPNFQQQQPHQFNFHQANRLRRGGTPPAQTPSPTHSPAPQSPGTFFYGQGTQVHPHEMMHAQAQRGYMPTNNAFKSYMPHTPVDQTLGHLQNGNAQAHQHAFANGLATAAFAAQPQGSPAPSLLESPHAKEQKMQLATSRASAEPHWHAREAAKKHASQPVLVAGGVNPNIYNPPTSQHRKDGPTEVQKAKSNEDGEIQRQDWQALDLGGQGLPAVAPSLFAYAFLDKLYLNHNKIKTLPPAIGQLKVLQLLDVSSNLLDELPAEIGMLSSLKQLLLFDNNIQVLNGCVGYLSELDFIGVEGNPLIQEQRQLIATEGTKGLILHLREQSLPPDPPNQRDWVEIDALSSEKDREADRVSAVTYNILCDKMATAKQYGYCPAWALKWESRKDILKEELRASKSDIICLQEVDQTAFEEFFAPQLATDGYKGYHALKSRAKTMGTEDAKVVDGCAIFYKTNKYVQVAKYLLEFGHTAINRPGFSKTDDVFNRVMNKDNIAILVLLENKTTNMRMIVANVHCTWSPEYKDVKLVQTAMLLETVNELATRWNAQPPEREDMPNPPTPYKYKNITEMPILICGDFNSVSTSGVYELLSKGSVPASHSDLKDRSYGDLTNEGFAHPFPLRSAYNSINELKFTNYTPTFTGAIDYIWYNTSNMTVTGLLGQLDSEYLKSVPGFPNAHFPSDHILLQAEFQVRRPKEERPRPPPPDFGGGGGGGGSSRAR